MGEITLIGIGVGIGFWLGYIISGKLAKRGIIEKRGRADILYYTPFCLLGEYLNCGDLIKLASTNRYLQKQVYLNARPTVEIYDVLDQVDLQKIFKDIKVTMKLSSKIRNDEIKNLGNIVSLDARDNGYITDHAFDKLRGLRSLSIGGYRNQISTDAIYRLTQLTSLNVSDTIITDDELDNLTLLKALKFNNMSNRITDFGLMKLTNLTDLNMKFGLVSDRALISLTNLTCLKIYFTPKITDHGIRSMSRLKVLAIGGRHNYASGVDNITNAGIIGLDLTDLDINNHNSITDEAVVTFKNLRSLNIKWNSKITVGVVSTLVGLRSLNISYNDVITDDAVRSLTNLTSLNLFGNKIITVYSLKYLGKLKHLDLGFNPCISGIDFRSVPNLTDLNLNYNSYVNCDHLGHLTRLRALRVYESISDRTLRKLTNLTSLTIRGAGALTKKGLISLPKLKMLYLANRRGFKEPYSVRKLRSSLDDRVPTWESENPVSGRMAIID
ncbi:MAG: hypothetical protein Hyperionvirus5_112 [Hyperionvirus sp.]|uniref:Leucine-rich repeat protein n=1 Tax=Hyperionvirus sp. TaxID=2487770 RepID=A0A3G5A7S1_9VIRU|nr:MAG: hypothetical protein Hyperionvirus5_112 [Hyperionvirus sp.]